MGQNYLRSDFQWRVASSTPTPAVPAVCPADTYSWSNTPVPPSPAFPVAESPSFFAPVAESRSSLALVAKYFRIHQFRIAENAALPNRWFQAHVYQPCGQPFVWAMERPWDRVQHHTNGDQIGAGRSNDNKVSFQQLLISFRRRCLSKQST